MGARKRRQATDGPSTRTARLGTGYLWGLAQVTACHLDFPNLTSTQQVRIRRQDAQSTRLKCAQHHETLTLALNMHFPREKWKS